MDTNVITGIYLQRPTNLMALSLGEWFSRATKLGDKDLEHTASAFSAKEKILSRQYNTLPELTWVLNSFNRENVEL